MCDYSLFPSTRFTPTFTHTHLFTHTHTCILTHRQLKKNSADVQIELPCCLMACAFHPDQPSVIAGGLYSGEVKVWDVDTEVGMRVYVCVRKINHVSTHYILYHPSHTTMLLCTPLRRS